MKIFHKFIPTHLRADQNFTFHRIKNFYAHDPIIVIVLQKVIFFLVLLTFVQKYIFMNYLENAVQQQKSVGNLFPRKE